MSGIVFAAEMSVNNRKYLTSTGMLLKQLNEESNNTQNIGSYHHSNSQMYAHASANNYHQQNNSSSIHNLGSSMNQYHQPSYSNMPSYNMPNQFSSGLFPNVQNSMPVTVAAAAALLSKLAAPNQFTPQPSVPDIMMLPGSMSQQRWQQKSNKNSSNHPYQQQQKQQKHTSVNKKSNISLTSSSSSSSVTAASSSSSASSVTELPETFGLPSNKISKTSHSKYASSTTSLQSSSTVPDSSKSQTDILIEDKSNEVVSSEANTKSDDIEIIGENYPSNDLYSMENSSPAVTVNSNSTAQNTMMIQTAFQSNSDENFRNYLAKNYNSGQLAIATKPQCNFISNFGCINQILTECDFYNKLRRRKPYSNVKLNKIYDVSEDDESDEKVNDNENDAQQKQVSKIKSKKIIVIDDTNEDMHKPWITPELIKLIKHRNLLQTKINENNGKLDASADAELMKKFKNLRNKVTKLVKKARKEYLTKYIQESKENKITSMSSNKNEKQANQNDLDSDLINNLAKNPAPPPPPASMSATTQSISTASKSPSSSSTANTTTEKTSNANVSTNVSGIISQLSSTNNQATFLQNSNNLMMNLYNSYFNQYLQQYQHQQQQAQQIANAATAKTASSIDEANKKPEETDTGYDLLQKQAAYYAQQQRAIQSQLETSLSQSAQQLVQEIATMASKTSNQASGFIINQQFNHQQHYVIPPQQPAMGPFGGLY